jgi:type II secretory pathway predicted ATPase ExeA
MYESFYGLKAKPFSMLPDPEFLYLGKKHQMALTLLEYGLMNQAGFCVISGETGAGKTTLLRKLLTHVGDDVTVGMITNTHQSFGELLDWILSAYGIHEKGLSKVDMHQRFVDFLLEQYANNKTTLLIIDEAQNMPIAVLEELRMLSNLNSEKDQVLQVILAGQPGLQETLRNPALTQFAQRIAVDYRLDTLNSDEACAYIQHRLVTAGATDDVFTPEACRLIHAYSGGIPRLMNLLCDTALVYGFADQAKTVGAEIVNEMVKERMDNSVVPLINVKDEQIAQAEQADDINFPWINPEGGTKGLKPEEDAEKKTLGSVTNNTGDTEPAKQQSQETSQTSTPVATLAAVVKAKEESSRDSDAQNQADTPAKKPESSEQQPEEPSSQDEITATEDSSKTEHLEIVHEDNIEVISDDEFKQTGHHIRVIEPPSLMPTRGKWFIATVAAIIAVALSIFIGTYDYEPELSDEVKSKLAEAERMKQELQRMQDTQRKQYELMQQQAASLERERELAKAKMEDEERLRAQEAAAALEAAKQEKEAVAAAALAAEKALRAAEQAEKLSRQQRRNEAKLRAERERLEQERLQAELEKQRLEMERREAELEIKRLEQARLEAERLARQQWEEAAIKEQRAAIEKALAKETLEPEPVNQETTFSSDPCSSPSAKFLSTCK